MDGKTQEEVVPRNVAFVIGASIMLGFTLMLFIDETFKIIKEKEIFRMLASQQALKDKNFEHNSGILLATAADFPTAKSRREDKQKQSALLTTIALCVHSLAEGVAMGASLYRKWKFFLNCCDCVVGQTADSGGSASVGFMITLALFLHKAPEAAGYGTFIVHMK